MHTHVWRWHSAYGEDGIDCSVCAETHGYRPENWMDKDEVIRRLNAVEMLSAKQAVDAAEELGAGLDWQPVWATAPLRAYARILEGETT